MYAGTLEYYEINCMNVTTTKRLSHNFFVTFVILESDNLKIKPFLYVKLAIQFVVFFFFFCSLFLVSVAIDKGRKTAR